MSANHSRASSGYKFKEHHSINLKSIVRRIWRALFDKFKDERLQSVGDTIEGLGKLQAVDEQILTEEMPRKFSRPKTYE